MKAIISCLIFLSTSHLFPVLAEPALKNYSGRVTKTGVLKTIDDDKLVVAGIGPNPATSYPLAANAKVFINGKEAKVDDLQTGGIIVFTLTKEGRINLIRQEIKGPVRPRPIDRDVARRVAINFVDIR